MGKNKSILDGCVLALNLGQTFFNYPKYKTFCSILYRIDSVLFYIVYNVSFFYWKLGKALTDKDIFLTHIHRYSSYVLTLQS